MSEVYEGRFLCGAERCRTTAPPRRVALCGCTAYRKRTGSAFGVSVCFDDGDVELVEGTLRTHRFDRPTFRYDLAAAVFTRSMPGRLVVPAGVDAHDTAPVTLR